MKTVICILAFLAFADAIEEVDLFNSQALSKVARDVLLKVRDQMPCGFPAAGVPPLVPYVINEKEININNSAVSAVGKLENVRVYNLNEFDLKDLQVDPISNTVSFHYTFKNLTAEASYKLDSFTEKKGLGINLKGAGRAGITFADVEIRGTSQYSLGLLTMDLETLKIRARIGSVETDIESVSGNKILTSNTNEALEEAIKDFINDNEEYITNTFESVSLPMVNEILDKYTLIEMMAFILGAPPCQKSDD